MNKLAAQLICGTYFALVSITCLNLYIALLSDTFSTILGNATATAYMLQGEVRGGQCLRKTRTNDRGQRLFKKSRDEEFFHEIFTKTRPLKCI